MNFSFKDDEIEDLDLEKIENIEHLIIRYLCGEKNYQLLSKDEINLNLLENSINNAKINGLNYRQFNGLLLLLRQDRVTEDFFKFLFKKDIASLNELKQGIIRFRGFAMLYFGNLKFAFKQLIQMDETELKDRLKPHWGEFYGPVNTANASKSRSCKILEIDNIDKDKTWYLGEVTGSKIQKEIRTLNGMEENENVSIFNKNEIEEFKTQLRQMDKDAKEVENKALKNTDIYLTWDYMDIYIATSMRNKWEFEETYDFLKEVFCGDNSLNSLNLHYFDPTQSKCRNPRDKGLIEGLMLKRVSCTLYLAQESDTMGKDSELAATLAQGKPVIAYIPKHDINEYSIKIKEYPLDFFKKRLLLLNAEGVLSDKDFINELPEELKLTYLEIIKEFLNSIDQYRQEQPFSLWLERENKFKEENREKLESVCKILTIAECYNFERRVDLLTKYHPLSMQVDLKAGVANGVLVVRDSKQCAELLGKILANNMEFTIKHEDGFYFLQENISGSPFRVITDNEILANSFWNFFA
ncbi:MAG: hypothetical protein ACYDB5_10495 [bacterium]